METTQRYTVLWMSCRYAAGGKGSRISVPFSRTRRTPCTSSTGDPSTDSQSTDGGGLPDAEQSSHPPLELENSSLGGGSNRKLGPRRCESNPAPLHARPAHNELHIRLTNRWKSVLNKVAIFSFETLEPTYQIQITKRIFSAVKT